MKPRPDKQLILDSITAMAKESGRAPSRSKFLSLSGISEHQVLEFFPTWSDAVRAAGLLPHTMNRRLEDRELFEDWAFVVRTRGKIPSRRAYRHLGQYDTSTFQRRFGPWSKLPEAFRNFAQWQAGICRCRCATPRPRTKTGAKARSPWTCSGALQRVPRAKARAHPAHPASPRVNLQTRPYLSP